MFQASEVSQVLAFLVVHHEILNVSLSGLRICFDSELTSDLHVLNCGALVCSHRIVDFRIVTNFGNPTVL